MTEIAPIALRQLDDMTGSRTAEGFQVATEQYPHLQGLAVILNNSGVGKFQPSELGLGGSYIEMNPNVTVYDEPIRSGLVTARMGEFSKFYRERGVLPKRPELVTSIFLHELGHAEDFHAYIIKNGGDVAAAFKLSREVRSSQLATLPLKISSSRVRHAYDNNTQGYRDNMLKAGYDETKLAKAILENSEAYTQLACEQVADRFALGVLATMYS
jgi:hypothetical protein